MDSAGSTLSGSSDLWLQSLFLLTTVTTATAHSLTDKCCHLIQSHASMPSGHQSTPAQQKNPNYWNNTSRRPAPLQLLLLKPSIRSAVLLTAGALIVPNSCRDECLDGNVRGILNGVMTVLWALQMTLFTDTCWSVKVINHRSLIFPDLTSHSRLIMIHLVHQVSCCRNWSKLCDLCWRSNACDDSLQHPKHFTSLRDRSESDRLRMQGTNVKQIQICQDVEPWLTVLKSKKWYELFILL